IILAKVTDFFGLTKDNSSIRSADRSISKGRTSQKDVAEIDYNELFKRFAKLLLLGAVPLASITLASAACRRLFQGSGSWHGDVFIAGTCQLPLAFFSLVASIVGLPNLEVIVTIFVFAICCTILMLYVGCTRIHRISEAASTVAVPLMILLSGWIEKILV